MPASGALVPLASAADAASVVDVIGAAVNTGLPSMPGPQRRSDSNSAGRVPHLAPLLLPPLPLPGDGAPASLPLPSPLLLPLPRTAADTTPQAVNPVKWRGASVPKGAPTAATGCPTRRTGELPLGQARACCASAAAPSGEVGASTARWQAASSIVDGMDELPAVGKDGWEGTPGASAVPLWLPPASLPGGHDGARGGCSPCCRFCAAS